MLAIDHFIFPVASLDTIKTQMEQLGFTLAPRAEHPFGTANICLFLKGNVYIEFLALHDEAVYARALKEDYPFIRDVDGWRQRNGDEGFSGLAFSSKDGHADHARFEGMGISGRRIGEFSRQFSLPDGSTDIASFRTAHTNLTDMPEIVCFTCQRVKVPKVDRSSLESHANGVQRAKKIIIAAPEPLILRSSLTKLLDGAPSLAVPDALAFALPNIELIVLTPAAIMEAFGVKVDVTTPRLVGLEMTTSSLSQLEHFQQKWTPVLRETKCVKNKELERSTEPSEVKTALEQQFSKSNLSFNLSHPDMLLHRPFSGKDIFWVFSQS